MNDVNQIIVLRDNAKAQLEKIQSVEDGISYLNKLKAIDVWVKAEKKDAELQNIVAEQKLRTQRILGELVAEGQSKGTIATTGNPDKFNSTKREELKEARSIESIGLSHKQSSAFQQIASIPEEKFEEFISEKKAAVNDAVAELTTTGALKLAKSLSEKKNDLDEHIARQTQLDEEKELKKIAQNINMNYGKEQRRFFVNLIKI